MNVSDGKENYSQRNNKYIWNRNIRRIASFSMCNVTSMCMMLDYNGVKLPTGEYKQPEDNLAKFIMTSKKVDDRYKKEYGGLYRDYEEGTIDCYVPIEVHDLLAYGTNLWLRNNGVNNAEVKFNAQLPVKELQNIVRVKKQAVVVSGRIPQAGSKTKVFNHIVTLVGLNDIGEVIFDDPYGFVDDNGAHYGDGRTGNDCVIGYDKFLKWFKPCDQQVKYAHYLV